MKAARLTLYRFHVNNAAFTLVELMVVIAIIALLATLVFSGYGAARAQGLAAAAVSNFRKASVAEQLFTSEMNGWVNGPGDTRFPPPGRREGGASWRVTPYLVDVSFGELRWADHVMPAWRPLWDRALPYDIIWGGQDPSGYRYAVSYNMEFHIGWGSGNDLLTHTGFKRIFNYARPQTTLHFVTGIWRFLPQDLTDPAQQVLPTTSPRQGIYYPHNRRTVAAFMDGRVELLRYPIPQYMADPNLPLPR